MNVNELSDRLDRLERENRRMKRAGLAVVAVALAVALIGAATPDEIPEVIEANLDEKTVASAEKNAQTWLPTLTTGGARCGFGCFSCW